MPNPLYPPRISRLATPPSPGDAGREGRRGGPGLVAAVAAIVAIAAERERAAGNLAALRDAVERALDTAAPSAAEPHQPASPELPHIAEAEPLPEEARLRRMRGLLRSG